MAWKPCRVNGLLVAVALLAAGPTAGCKRCRGGGTGGAGASSRGADGGSGKSRKVVKKPSPSGYSDLKGPLEVAARKLVAVGVLPAGKGKKLAPGTRIPRVEAFLLLLKAARIGRKAQGQGPIRRSWVGKPSFTDMGRKSPLFTDLEGAVKAGVFRFFPEKRFGAGRHVTREILLSWLSGFRADTAVPKSGYWKADGEGVRSTVFKMKAFQDIDMKYAVPVARGIARGDFAAIFGKSLELRPNDPISRGELVRAAAALLVAPARPLRK